MVVRQTIFFLAFAKVAASQPADGRTPPPRAGRAGGRKNDGKAAADAVQAAEKSGWDLPDDLNAMLDESLMAT